MAVYTKINSKDLLSLSRDYNLGKIIKSEGIKKGIENTNYLRSEEHTSELQSR